MSQENTYLVILSIILCSLNIFLGPIAVEIAKFFAYLFPGKPESESAHADEVGDLSATIPASAPSQTGQ